MNNRIALVFGGTRGSGAACVRRLAAAGFDVAYTYVSSNPDLPERIGGARIRSYAVDVRDAAQVAAAFAAATAATPRVVTKSSRRASTKPLDRAA